MCYQIYHFGCWGLRSIPVTTCVNKGAFTLRIVRKYLTVSFGILISNVSVSATATEEAIIAVLECLNYSQQFGRYQDLICLRQKLQDVVLNHICGVIDEEG